MIYITIEKHAIPQTRETSRVEYFVDRVVNNASSCLQSFYSMNEAEKFANQYCKDYNLEFKSHI